MSSSSITSNMGAIEATKALIDAFDGRCRAATALYTFIITLKRALKLKAGCTIRSIRRVYSRMAFVCLNAMNEVSESDELKEQLFAACRRGIGGRSLFALVLTYPKSMLHQREMQDDASGDELLQLKRCVEEIDRVKCASSRCILLKDISQQLNLCMAHPNRDLVMKMSVVHVLSSCTSRVILYLFTDVVVGVIDKSLSLFSELIEHEAIMQSRVKFCIDLYGGCIAPLTSCESKRVLELSNKRDQRVVILYFEQISEKDQFFNAIQTQISQLTCQGQTIWMPDKDAIRCCVCARRFIVIGRRRHHCRRW